jgi:hypothetical protein
MCLKQTEKARSLRQAGEQRPPITHKPPIEGTIANTFDSKDEGQRHDLARMKRGLAMFRHILHLIIYTTKQFSDKVLGGHDGSLLLQMVWSPLH